VSKDQNVDGVGVIHRTEAAALTNARALLQLAASGVLRCSTTTRRPTAATVRTVGEHLVDGDWYDDEDIAAYAWPLLLQAGGLAKLNGTRLELTARGRRATTLPAHEVIAGLWTRWISHGLIDELSRVENIKGQRSTRTLTAVSARRSSAAGVLDLLPLGDWRDIDEVLTAARRSPRTTFEVAQNGRALWKLYLGPSAEWGSFGYGGFYHWNLIEGRYVMALLLEYAATLGLIDVELDHPRGAREDFGVNEGSEGLEYLSRYDGLRAVRLTPLGAYATGQAATYTPAVVDEAALTVGADLVVAAATAPSIADRMVLTAFAEDLGGLRWQISRPILLDALDTGHSLDELTTLLTSRGASIPDTLDNLLADVRRASGALTDLGVTRLIACADEHVAADLSRDTRLGRWCRRIGTHHLAVEVDKIPQFRKRLKELGHVLDTGTHH